MAVKKLKWSSLLRYAELEFEPEAPKVLEVSDELVQSLSWLTAATQQDRRLVRCTEQGALLVADAWCGLTSVETDELYTIGGFTDTFTATKLNKGVLIANSTAIIKLSITRKGASVAEVFYVPPNSYYWYPYPVGTVDVNTVPADTGEASYVGLTFFN